jgi:TetR/AcrR family transcriptional repressor of bet genes
MNNDAYRENEFNSSEPDQERGEQIKVRRRESKAFRREQLILATIDSIADRGYAATTMAHVSDGAGLSRGIVNFHFESKEKLFVETLQYMADEYASHWNQRVAIAGNSAAAKMEAIIHSDFDELVCNTRKISTWTAFRAEAVNNMAYRDLCWSTDEGFLETLEEYCDEMKKEAGYGYDSKSIGAAIYAMQEGLWLRLMLEGRQMTRDDARKISVRMIGSLFPKHFHPDGQLRKTKSKL